MSFKSTHALLWLPSILLSSPKYCARNSLSISIKFVHISWTSSFRKNWMRVRFEFSRKTLQKFIIKRGILADTAGSLFRACSIFLEVVGRERTMRACKFSLLSIMCWGEFISCRNIRHRPSSASVRSDWLRSVRVCVYKVWLSNVR